MLSVRATAMVALMSTLAAVAIGASMKARSVAKAPAAATPAAEPQLARVSVQTPVADDFQLLAARRLTMPVKGYEAVKLRDNFDELRGGSRKHEALDIMAPRGTPVVAVDDGVITKLFKSAAGGITIYQSDASEKFIYYYAHLDRYAEGLKEGQVVQRGQVIGYVGSTGNAPASAPHLHFTIFQLGADKKWWKGRAVNPYPYLAAR